MLNSFPSASADRSAGLSMRDRAATQIFCLVLLTAASASASLVFACATPFAAFAVVAAAMLPLRGALLAVGAAWLTNQLLGFGVLGYPRNLNAVEWGLVIAAAAACATIVCSLLFARLASFGRFAVYPIAFIASFVAYEVSLAAAVPVLGGGDGFTVTVIGNIGLANVIWAVGLIGIYEASRWFGGTREVFGRRTA
jgi:hypothetical protein